MSTPAPVPSAEEHARAMRSYYQALRGTPPAADSAEKLAASAYREAVGELAEASERVATQTHILQQVSKAADVARQRMQAARKALERAQGYPVRDPLSTGR